MVLLFHFIIRYSNHYYIVCTLTENVTHFFQKKQKKSKKTKKTPPNQAFESKKTRLFKKKQEKITKNIKKTGTYHPFSQANVPAFSTFLSSLRSYSSVFFLRLAEVFARGPFSSIFSFFTGFFSAFSSFFSLFSAFLASFLTAFFFFVTSLTSAICAL